MPPRNLVHAPRLRCAPLFALALAACTNSELPTATPALATTHSLAPAGQIALTANPALAVVPANVTITQGRGILLRGVIIDPLNAKQAAAPIGWSSSNPAVATVSSTGQVRGVAPGTATITASAVDRRFLATSTVTVAARPNCEQLTPVPANLTGIIGPIPPGYEDAPLIFRMAVDDPDLCHRYTYRLVGAPVSGALYQVSDDGTPRLDAILSVGTTVTNTEGWVAYIPKPNFNGTDSFHYDVRDQSGGVYAFLPVVPIQVLPVNDAPVAFPATHVGANNVAVTNVFLQGTDIEGFHPDFCVTELPRTGDLYWSSVAPSNRVAVGDCRPANSLRFVSRIDGVFGCGALPARSTYPHTDNFRWYASDGNAVSETVTGAIRIDYVNQPPAYRGPERVSTTEDTPVTFTPNGLDPDGDVVAYLLNTLPRHGSLWALDAGSAPRQITSVPALFLGGSTLQYVPDADFNTLTLGDDIHLQLTDGDILPTCDRTIRFDVTPVNDAPTIIAPDRIDALVALGGIGQPTGFSIGVADDARPTDVMSVTLRAQGAAAARIDLVDPAGLGVRRISALEVRFDGTFAAINAVLGRGVLWTPNASGANYGELAIIVDDRGNFGPGGPRVGTKIVAVDVGIETEGGLEGLRAASPANAGVTTRRPPVYQR